MTRLFVFHILLISLFVSCNDTEKVVNVDNESKTSEEYFVDKKSKKKEGDYVKKDLSGNILETSHYVDDHLDGENAIYYPGTKQLFRKALYKIGKLNGDYVEYFQNGKIRMQGLMKDDKHAGEWKGYYESGQLKQLVTFVDGQENGPFVEYYENGTTSYKGAYKTGVDENGVSNEDAENKEHGELLHYDEGGNLIQKMDCQWGICRTTWRVDSLKSGSK